MTKNRSDDDFFRKVVESMNDAVFVTDPDGRFRYVCPNVLPATGLSADEFHAVGRADQMFYPDPAAELTNDDDVQARNIPVRISGSPDGPVDLLMSVRRSDINGDALLYVGRSFNNFDFAQNMMHRMFWQAQNAILFVARNNRLILNCNPASTRVLGYDRSELLGNSTEMLHVDGDGFVRYGETVLTDLDERGHAECEWQMRHKDGRILDVEITTVQVTGSERQGVGYISMIHDISRRRAAEVAERRSRENLRQLSQHIEHMRETERRDLARELHDQLGSDLTGLKLQLTAAAKCGSDAERRDEYNRKATEIVDMMIGTIRTMAMRLRPAVLDDYGLGAGLEFLVRQFDERSDCSITCRIDDRLTELDPEAVTALFRVCQESLTNVIRHAAATEVKVVLRREGDSVVLKVTDNGRGTSLDEQKTSRKLGILGMQERMLGVGGHLDITSVAGSGTAVRAVLPMLAKTSPVSVKTV